MKVVGLDIGNKRIGIAVSDSAGRVAVPSRTFFRAGDLERDIRRLAEVILEYEPVAVIAGVPVSLSGEIGPQAVVVLSELKILSERIGLEIRTQDERLTTKAATAALRAAGKTSKQQRSIVDAISAAIILQDWLDSERD